MRHARPPVRSSGSSAAHALGHAAQAIEEATGKIYNGKGKDGKKIDKGIAFPTCISPNHCVGHYSPLVRSRPAACTWRGAQCAPQLTAALGRHSPRTRPPATRLPPPCVRLPAASLLRPCHSRCASVLLARTVRKATGACSPPAPQVTHPNPSP